ncbi:unnamed protein product, partial [Mesorhabditis belari]|uniref:CUE domain-containing protein n=1 Tax=Mesorhabditis belari TaxID=2138241 RepID=A0AAF3J1K2_9BILA
MSTTTPLTAGLFSTNRFPSENTNTRVTLYLPIGCIIFIVRIFLGLQTFVAACVLRKTHALRGLVLRVMSALLGIVATSSGEKDESVRVFVANHISCLDHMAVDLIRPCLLPSVWDIPNVLRWLFGYADLGVRSGRGELVRQARLHIKSDDLPLLALPEAAMTNGKKALLRFSSWPFEVSDRIQPCTLRLSRPFFNVESTIIGASWWQDTLWFLFLPCTIINVKWLPTMQRDENESMDSFRDRVAQAIANELGIELSNWTSADAVEAAKKYRQETQRLRIAQGTPSKPTTSRTLIDPKRMDEVAMRIKQSHPTVALLNIRRDLEKTKDMQSTIERIKNGTVKPISTAEHLSNKKSPGSSPNEWHSLYEERKWTMIEENRAKYLQKHVED